MSIDTIGNFLTAIRNALLTSKRSVQVPFSKMNKAIADVLKEEGYIRDFKKIDNDRSRSFMSISLKYVKGESVIHELKRVSVPSRRNYEGAKKITSVIGGLGVSILTTSSGVITDREARKRGIGGEVICHVW